MEIKDSGERTRFDTGAVRDMHTGKGRMDLLPWEALVEVSKHCEEGALKYQTPGTSGHTNPDRQKRKSTGSKTETEFGTVPLL